MIVILPGDAAPGAAEELRARVNAALGAKGFWKRSVAAQSPAVRRAAYAATTQLSMK